MTDPSNSDGDSTKYCDRARVIMISVIRPSNYMVTEEEAEEGIIAGGISRVKRKVLKGSNFPKQLSKDTCRYHSSDFDKSMRTAVTRVKPQFK